MANVNSTNAALAAALRQIPGREEGGECISIFSTSGHKEMFDLYRIRVYDIDTGFHAIINVESVRKAFVAESIEHMAGEGSLPILFCMANKKGGGQAFRHEWVLVASDLTPAMINKKQIRVGFNFV